MHQSIKKSDYPAWLSSQSERSNNWLLSNTFKAKSGSLCLLPKDDGKLDKVLFIIESENDFWLMGDLLSRLPKGQYHLCPTFHCSNELLHQLFMAWGSGAYRFDAYREKSPDVVQLMYAKEIDVDAMETLVSSIYLVRDLINTPSADMGPEELSDAAKAIALECNADVSEIVGDALLDEGYNLIHAVGRASSREPSLVDIRWGKKTDRKITLIGKGVCFDAGGLNIKPGGNMRLMKKDMAGAAHILGLARLIMKNNLPVCLRVLLPMADNMLSGDSYKPGDVLTARDGTTIEITNTDAEGRLLLADALIEAVSENPELIIDMASLTGAARVALGPDVPVIFGSVQSWVDQAIHAGERLGDLLWQLPLQKSYRRYLKSDIADTTNASIKPYGGAITAALFLQRFVPESIAWLHVDLMGYHEQRLPGRPIGADATGMRALYEMLFLL